MPAPRVILVDSDPEVLKLLAIWLRLGGCEVTACTDGSSAIGLLTNGEYDAIVTDTDPPGFIEGRMVDAAHEAQADIEAIVLTGSGTLAAVRKFYLEQRGYAYLLKPLDDIGLLAKTVHRAAARRRRKKAQGGRIPMRAAANTTA